MYYLKIEMDNVISDCITYQADNYIEFNGKVPADILGGWYKLEDGIILEIPEKNPNNIANLVQAGQDELMDDLIQRGLII